MIVGIFYIAPQVNLPKYIPAAQLFVKTFLEHPPGIEDYNLTVISCGGDGGEPWVRKTFDPLPCTFMPHNNVGKDVGAYQVAAEYIDCDLMLCFGAHVHFHRDGWLDRLLEVYRKHGPGMYGIQGCQMPNPHIRTTCFWVDRELLKQYPYEITDDARYSFEHSTKSMTLWTHKLGLEPRMVTWSRVMTMKEWQPAPVNDLLIHDQHTGIR